MSEFEDDSSADSGPDSDYAGPESAQQPQVPSSQPKSLTPLERAELSERILKREVARLRIELARADAHAINCEQAIAQSDWLSSVAQRLGITRQDLVDNYQFGPDSLLILPKQT